MSKDSLKEPLLFICHRIPFPPNKGDKIATFNLLKFLNKHFDIYLAYFIDDKNDFQYVDDLNEYCIDSFYVDICNRKQLISGLKGLCNGVSVTESHYQSERMHCWIRNLFDEKNIENVFVYSSGIYQFIESYADRNVVVDLCDVDSDKWRQYAEKKPWPIRSIYKREQKLLSQLEQNILDKVKYVGLVTEQESTLFREMSPQSSASKIKTISNGVDVTYFDPKADFRALKKTSSSNMSICFTGAMDYWANEDAVVWFCHYVWPEVSLKFPYCIFHIVGGNPSQKILSLREIQGVVVTGRVDDVRPYIDQAELVVAPMRIARGIQNKVLEGMAMSKVVVMTTMAQEGIEVHEHMHPFIIDDAKQMSEAICQLLSKDTRELGRLNRQWILDKFSWNGALKGLLSLFNHYENK